MQTLLAQIFRALTSWAIPGLAIGLGVVAFFGPGTAGGTFLALLIGMLIWGAIYVIFIAMRRVLKDEKDPDPKTKDWQDPL